MATEGVIKFTYQFFPYPPVHVCNIQELDEWRQVFYHHNILGQDPCRYDGAGFGNVSKRCPPFSTPQNKRSFFVTGTQTGSLGTLAPHNYTTVLEYYIEKNLIVTEGPVLPSSESLTHGAIYNISPEIRYVFHTHSPDIWRKAKLLGIPVTAPDIPYGTVEMAQEVKKLFLCTDVPSTKIFAMGGHEDGIISFGKSASEAGEVMLHYLIMAQKKL